MKVLMINGCVRGEKSRSWKLAEAFLAEMKKKASEQFDPLQHFGVPLFDRIVLQISEH